MSKNTTFLEITKYNRGDLVAPSYYPKISLNENEDKELKTVILIVMDIFVQRSQILRRMKWLSVSLQGQNPSCSKNLMS